jgi:zinc carboxypeptidase
MSELKDLTHLAAVRDEKKNRSEKQKTRIRSQLPELERLERILADAPELVDARVIERVSAGDLELPVYRIDIGKAPDDAPALLLVGGVHGLEQIGTQVVLAWLESLLNRIRWDGELAGLLDKVRLVVVPLLNPGGMLLNRRSNPNGVDLMRNAPLSAQSEITWPLGGQRLSRHLPWFTGQPDIAMEPESRALEAVVSELMPGRPFCISLDCHSGFGTRDQIWFPYAYRRRPMRRVADVMALKLLWEQAYPHHDYAFEPQSMHYVTHGDLWDYFYKQINKQSASRFLPLTLEMGSWRWVRKRPRQLLRLEGLFNPMIPHRQHRVLRSHLVLLDFLFKATLNYARWLPDAEQERTMRQAALVHWYR